MGNLTSVKAALKLVRKPATPQSWQQPLCSAMTALLTQRLQCRASTSVHGYLKAGSLQNLYNCFPRSHRWSRVEGNTLARYQRMQTGVWSTPVLLHGQGMCVCAYGSTLAAVKLTSALYVL